MKQILSDAWRLDRRGLLTLLALSAGVALTGGIGTVMLVPMLDLLEIDLSGGSALDGLLRPFAALTFYQRSAAIISIFVALLLLRALVNRLSAIHQNKFLEGYEMSLRQRLYEAIAGADWETLARKKHTDLVNLFTTQCRQARLCLQWTLSLFGSAVSAALQLAIACWLSLPLTLMILAVGVVFLLAFRPFQKRSRACGQQAVEVSRSMYREISNQLNSIKETRAYGVEDAHAALFQAVSQDYYDISLKTTQLRVLPQTCYAVAAAVLIALAFVISVLVLNVDAARLVILVYIFSRLWPMFSSWQGQLQNIMSYIPAYEKIREAIESMPPACQGVTEASPLDFQEEISFEHVRFSYRDSREPVLEEVSFTLPFGSVTALCGRSGAGKSTTADLLLGLLQPTGGQVTVDGVPLTAENAPRWRRSTGYVPQSPLIIDGTVRENLLRFHPDATEEEMVQALKGALAWEFVEKLEHGLDTVLGAKGVRLSGGEGQRIVLARVLLGQPRLIILDEATSALDYESEAMIRQTIQALKGRTTVLIIAHRLATIRSAERAIVLEDSRVAECGPLQELLNNKNSYLARMVMVE